jgi:hypothetical protein
MFICFLQSEMCSLCRKHIRISTDCPFPDWLCNLIICEDLLPLLTAANSLGVLSQSVPRVMTVCLKFLFAFCSVHCLCMFRSFCTMLMCLNLDLCLFVSDEVLKRAR